MADAEVLSIEDLEIGEHIPWDIYDNYEVLLLKKGSLVISSRQLKALVSRGIYHIDEPKELEDTSEKAVIKELCPFDVIYEYAYRLDKITQDLLEKNNSANDIEQRIRELCQEIQAWAKTDSDALLGAVHLCFDFSYSLMHAIHVAILCELIGQRYIDDVERRNTIMCAGLTCNITMTELQNVLQNQPERLTEEQQLQINSHPETAAKLLHENGITNSLWLKFVLQHHERLDGTGYPAKVSGDDLLTEANLISIADRYAAMIAGRSYRKGIHPKEVLKQIFIDRGKVFSEQLSLLLIKELGIYPPGAFVNLNNGEIAIVTQRALNSVTPVVKSIVSPRGGPYAQPLLRDCGHLSYTITGICEIDKEIHLNLPMIWDYR